MKRSVSQWVWSGDYSVANQRARDAGLKINLQYIVPKEGSEMWFDNIYIPSDAKHIDNAYLFLNYMLRPEVIAATSDYIDMQTQINLPHR